MQCPRSRKSKVFHCRVCFFKQGILTGKMVLKREKVKKNSDFADNFLRKHLMRDILNILEVVIVLHFLIIN